MKKHDFSWLAAMPAFNDFETPDDLVDALLSDANLYDAVAVFNSSESSDRSTRSHVPELPSRPITGLNEALTATNSSKHPVKKRKRAPCLRPKEEIDRLRRSVLDLERIISLSHQRRHVANTNSTERISHSTTPLEASAMWMDVASRQFKSLRASQLANDELRIQVHQQLHIIQRLMRLVVLAQRGLPTLAVPTRITHFDAERFIMKRAEVLERARQMERGIALVVHDKHFLPAGQEQSESAIFCDNSNNIEAGALLATGWIRRCVPNPGLTLCDSLWSSGPELGLSKDSFHMEIVEQRADCQLVHFKHATSQSPTLFGVAVRLRSRHESRHTIITTSAMWPSQTSVSPWSCVGIDTQQWLVVKTKPESRDDLHADVLAKVHILKLAHSLPAVGKSETSLLKEFAATSVRHTIEHLHRHVDRLLLGQPTW